MGARARIAHPCGQPRERSRRPRVGQRYRHATAMVTSRPAATIHPYHPRGFEARIPTGRSRCSKKGLRRSREAGTHLRQRVSPSVARRQRGESIQVPVGSRPGLLHTRERLVDACGRAMPHRGWARLMPATVVVGLQWGDEGKGKATDLLAETGQPVVRYQGGDNAGHTIVIGDEVVQAPPGAERRPPSRTSRRSSATASSSTPRRCSTRWPCSARAASPPTRIRVSAAAHVIMPYHVALDRGHGGAAAGAAASARRTGHRAGLRRPGAAHRHPDGRPARPGALCGLRSSALCRRRTPLLAALPAAEPFDARAALRTRARAGASALRPQIVDTDALVQDALARRRARAARGRPGHAARPRPRAPTPT